MDMSDEETPSAKKAANKRRRIDNDKLKVKTVDQISIKTPKTRCRLFLKIDQLRYLAAGVWGPLPSKVFVWWDKAIL